MSGGWCPMSPEVGMACGKCRFIERRGTRVRSRVSAVPK